MTIMKRGKTFHLRKRVPVQYEDVEPRKSLYLTPEQIARRFVRARASTVEPLMQSLAALGQADLGEDGRYAA